MNGCNNWRGHKWPKWSPPVHYQPVGEPPTVQGQKQERACERCGMVQVYRVNVFFMAQEL